MADNLLIMNWEDREQPCELCGTRVVLTTINRNGVMVTDYFEWLDKGEDVDVTPHTSVRCQEARA